MFVNRGVRFICLCFALFFPILGVLAADVVPAQDLRLIQIGFIGPLTGPRASIGLEALHGAELAIDEVNRSAGLKGMRFELVADDSQAEPQKGLIAYKKMVQQGIRIVITQNSNISLPISQLVNHDDVVQLAISTTSEKYSIADDLTFRTNGTTRQEGEVLAQYLIERLRLKPGALAVLAMEDEYPLSVRDNLLSLLKNSQVSVAYEETFLPKEFDFRSMVAKLKQMGIRYVTLIAYQTEAGYFVKQQKELALNPYLILGNVQVNNPEFFEIAGKAGEGVIVPYLVWDENHPAARQFRERYKMEPKFCAANAYDAVQIAYLALRKCGFVLDTGCLKPALFAIKDYAGMSGRKGFDDMYGDMEDHFQMLIASDGKFVPLKPEKE